MKIYITTKDSSEVLIWYFPFEDFNSIQVAKNKSNVGNFYFQNEKLVFKTKGAAIVDEKELYEKMLLVKKMLQ